MRGAVSLINLIIILAIVVAIGLTVWFFLSGFFTELGETGRESTQETLEVLTSCMKIEEAYRNKFFIRNCGKGVITNDSLNIYVDENLIDFDLDPISIGEGGTGTVILTDVENISSGQHSLRITNPNTETLTYFEALVTSLPESFVLGLDFEEDSGTIAYDRSGFGNNATLYNETEVCSDPPTVGCPKWVDGKSGKALSFDGHYDYAYIPLSQSLDITEDQITVEAWVKPMGNSSKDSDYEWQHMVSNYRGYWLDILGCRDDGGPHCGSDPHRHAFSFRVNSTVLGEVQVNGQTITTLGEWYHVLGTVNTSHVLLYVNGVLDAYEDFAGDLQPSGNPALLVAKYSGNPFDYDFNFNGTIDSVRIYNEALTPDEIPEQILNFRII